MKTKTTVSLEAFHDQAVAAIFDKPSDFVTALKAMPAEHPADHKFVSGEVPHVCYKCGFIEADVPTDCSCGHDLRWHAEHRIAPIYDEEAALLTAMGVGDEMKGVPSFAGMDSMDPLDLRDLLG